MTREETISIIKETMHYAYGCWMYEGDHEETAEEILEHELKLADSFDKGKNLLYLIEWYTDEHECFEDIQDKVGSLLTELKAIAQRKRMTYKKFILTDKLFDCKGAWERYVSLFDSNYPSMNESMRKQYVEQTYPYRFINTAWI